MTEEVKEADYPKKLIEEVNTLRHTLLHRLERQWRLIEEKYSLCAKFQDIRGLGEEHPVISVFLLATCLICFLPVICFMLSLGGLCFVVTSGFLLFGGTIATLIVIVVGTILLFGAFLAFGVTAVVVSGYFVIQSGANFGKKMTSSFHRSNQKPD